MRPPNFSLAAITLLLAFAGTCAAAPVVTTFYPTPRSFSSGSNLSGKVTGLTTPADTYFDVIDPAGTVRTIPAGHLLEDGSFRSSIAIAFGIGKVRAYVITADGRTDGEEITFVFGHNRPMAKDDRLYVLPGRPARVSVLQNDVEGPVVSILSVGDARHGKVEAHGGSLKYSPGASFTGHDRFTYTIGDAAGNTSTATVYVGPLYEAQSGTYQGVLERNDFYRAGLYTLTLTRTGAYTATLRDCTQSSAVRGQLQLTATPKAEDFQVVHSGALAGTILYLSLDAQSGEIFALVSYPHQQYVGVQLYKVTPYTSPKPSPHAGAYTVLLPPGNDSPPGYGYAVCHVTPYGTCWMAGRAGNNHPFTGGGREWRLDALNRGFSYFSHFGETDGDSLSGRIFFRADPGISDLDGSVVLFLRKRQVTANLGVLGSRYEVRDSKPALDFGPRSPNGEAFVRDGDYNATSVHFTFRLNRTNEVTESSPPHFALKIDPRSGIFRGSLQAPGSAGWSPMSGVVLQKSHLAAGLFSVKRRTGSVVLLKLAE